MGGGGGKGQESPITLMAHTKQYCSRLSVIIYLSSYLIYLRLKMIGSFQKFYKYLQIQVLVPSGREHCGLEITESPIGHE